MARTIRSRFFRRPSAVSIAALAGAIALSLACAGPAPDERDLPEIEAAQLGGEAEAVGSVLAGKPVLVWFWAPW